MTEKKQKSLFENLGKATLRGVRKCPKCGTYNGTRGLACKNKECSMKFKILKTKTSEDAEAVKINCIGLQIFSVKLPDTEDDSRCFVRLPLIEGMETLQDEAEVSIITRSAAICFAPGCRKPTEDLSTITLNMNPCTHTLPVVNCMVEAKTLILKEAILNVLPISDVMKQDICSLITKPEEESQLVQRVNKNTMVVKCIPDEQHPLGFLHFFLYEPVKNARRYKILCECKTGMTKPFVPREKQLCIHYYMCVCAFASDEKLSEEFKTLFNFVFNLKAPEITAEEVLKYSLSEEFSDLKDFFVDDICPPSKKKKNFLLNTDTVYLLQENDSSAIDKTKKRVYVSTKNSIISSEDKPIFTFDQWLGSVVERINQTMHYQFNGHPDPLVFQVPQSFFNILQQRLSEGSKKRRLPNSVVGYNRKDALPIGIFSKYTWKIINIIQLKRVFYTPEVTLEVQRSFSEIRDGVFVPLKEVKLDPEAACLRKLLESKPKHINPVELKTFLKVGHTALSQTEPTPFIIEWIPDILPLSHIGEMKLKFQYGHQRNGIVEHRFPNVPESTSIQ